MTWLVLSLWAADGSAQRPSPGNGYPEGTTLVSYATAESPVRVWYVTSGTSAPPLLDETPADGVPDYVSAAESIARQSLVTFEALGFRPLLVDTDYLPASQVGGDAAVDIYLVNMVNADGAFRIDGCVSGSRACFGFALIENDFAGFAYPTPLLGLKTVVSHELFHGIQNAYDSEQDSRWSEGSAVWAEEIAFPEQDDYERFVSAFLEKPSRPFDRPTGAAFGDPYPYGAALWPTFLTERYGEDFVREVWEGSADAEGRAADFLQVTAAILESRGETLADAFELFTQWNLFTAERADPARAYARGADWGAVSLDSRRVPTELGELQTEGLSASYHPLDLSAVLEPTELRLIETIAPLPRASLFPIAGDELGEPIIFEQLESGDAIAARLDQLGESAILVISGVAPGTPMRTVRTELGVPAEPDDESAMGGCQALGSSGASGSGLALFFVVSLLLVGSRSKSARAGLAQLSSLSIGLVLVASSSSHAQSNADDSGGGDIEQPGEVIVITGSRRETPLADAVVATEVISTTDIENSGATTLAELLANHPGVEVAPTFRGTAIRMQGLDPEYVLLLVDGNRTIGRIGGAVDLERYSLENIERIEIVKGASSALYGSDALAGVVNIITKRPERAIEGELDVRVGSFRELDASGRAGAAGRQWSVIVGGGFHRSDGFDLTPETESTTASAYREGSGNAKATWKVSDSLELAVSLNLLRRDLNGVDLGAGNAIFDRASITEEASMTSRLSWKDTKRPSNRFTLTSQANQFSDQLLLDQRSADDLDRFEKTRERLGRIESTYTDLLGAHLFGGGVEILGETLSADRLSEAGSRMRVSAFGQDEWLAIPSLPLVLSPGLRIDVDSQFGTHISPKLASRIDVSERVVVRASAGLGYRAPDFRELLLFFENPGVGYVVEGNPDLEPETSISVNGGIETKLRADLWLTFGAFENRITNLISIDLASPGGAGQLQRFSYVNVASARSRGFESLAKLKRVLGPATLNTELGYTLTDTRDDDAGRALPGRARHRVTLSGAMSIGRIKASVRGAFVGVRRFFSGIDGDGDGDEDVLSTDPTVMLDVRASARIIKRFVAYAGVSNLLNSGDVELMPMPPRAFFLGLKATY